jgi:hypothetical protein
VKSLSGPSLVGLANLFYCLRFETFFFVASYDSQGYGGGIRLRLHTGFSSRFVCCICCGLSSCYSDREVDILPYCSFPLFAELFRWKCVLLTLKSEWLRCCGNVFSRLLLSIGWLLNCDWPGPKLMWAVPTSPPRGDG